MAPNTLLCAGIHPLAPSSQCKPQLGAGLTRSCHHWTPTCWHQGDLSQCYDAQDEFKKRFMELYKTVTEISPGATFIVCRKKAGELTKSPILDSHRSLLSCRWSWLSSQIMSTPE